MIKCFHSEPCTECTDTKCIFNRLKNDETLELQGMRKATEKERKSTKNYIDSISKPTGITFDDLMLIHTQGLDEGIRCAICKNHNANDWGCDGGCVVDDEMYKKVMDVIDKALEQTELNSSYNSVNTELETPKPRWIPVTECQPNETGIYIATVKYGDKYAVGQRYYHGQYVGWEDSCVIAWMLFPEPYKEEENGI